MIANPFLGVVFHRLGGLASGSFYVPYRGVKKWSWEVYWLAGGFFSWIIAPWTLALINSRDHLAVLSAAPTSQRSEPREEIGAVRVIPENPALLDAAADHMMQHPRCIYPC